MKEKGLYLFSLQKIHKLSLTHTHTGSHYHMSHTQPTNNLEKAWTFHVTVSSHAYCHTDTTTVTAVTFPPRSPHGPSAELCPFRGLLMDFCRLPVTEGNWVSDCSTRASSTLSSSGDSHVPQRQPASPCQWIHSFTTKHIIQNVIH